MLPWATRICTSADLALLLGHTLASEQVGLIVDFQTLGPSDERL